MTDAVVSAVVNEQESAGGSAAQHERRRRMLDATIELASDGGFESVQMRAVAERADVWLAALVSWATGRVSAPEVERSVDLAVATLLP